MANTSTTQLDLLKSVTTTGGDLDQIHVVVDSGSITIPTGSATSAKQDTGNASLASIDLGVQAINSLTPSKYDYISLAYTGSNLTTVLFKTGGSGGTTVSTLTLAYSGSTLQSVTRT